MSFVGHGPTQKVIIDWDTESATYGVILRMSDADSIAPLLGYRVDRPYIRDGQWWQASLFHRPVAG